MKFGIFAAFFFSTVAVASAPPSGKGKSGWEAFAMLQNGNMRFFEGRLKHPNQDLNRKDEVAGGQHPHTILVSCSDSRVPPEIIFDQGLGDLFPIRVAGNVVNHENIASIEYAVAHLGAKLILVMGHESCGAVGAAIAAKEGVTNGSESLDVLVDGIRKNLSTPAVAAGATDKTFRQGVKENVIANVKALLRRSDIVREGVRKKELVIAHAIYSLKTGRVEFWDIGIESAAHDEAASAPVMQESPVEASVIAPPAAAKTKKKSVAAKAPPPATPAADEGHAHH